MSRFALCVALATTGLVACVGNVDNQPSPGANVGGHDNGTGNENESGPGDVDPGETVGRFGDQVVIHDTRRLNNVELRNTVTDLFGTDMLKDITLPPTLAVDGYDSYGEGLGVTESGATLLLSVAEELATRAVEGGHLPSCDVASIGIQACLEKLVTNLGMRTFRRPLSADESSRYSAGAAAFVKLLADDGNYSDEEIYKEARITVVTSLLSSPHFLYKVDALGAEAPKIPHLRQFRFASRLSYLVWGTMPDQQLLDAAATGTLDDPAVLDAQVDRLLSDSRAEGSLMRFVSAWLELSDVDSVTKNLDAYPNYSDRYPEYWREETRRFLSHALFDGDGSLSELFTADYSFVNKSLAALYGVTGPADDSTYAKVHFGAQRSAGLLSQGSFLAGRSLPNQTSPIHRGAYVRVRLLCTELAPPPDLDVHVPEPDPNATLREQVEVQTSAPACNGCHTAINPFGFAFEGFDGLGRWRDGKDEYDRALDTEVTVTTDEDIDGTYGGASDLTEAVANSAALASCFAKSYLRFALGRREDPSESETVGAIGAAFYEDGSNVKALVRAVVTHPAWANMAD